MTPSTIRRVPALRGIFGASVVASILMLTAGCDKHTETDAPQTTLAGKPRVLLFLFGDQKDPRVLPLATLADGQISPIALDSSGWKNFDKLYFSPGTTLSFYQDGKPVGDAIVRRGMWADGANALYTLPGCRAHRPLAAVTLSATPRSAVMLELLATSEPLLAPPLRAGIVPADLDSANALATRVAQKEGLTTSARGELDLVANALAIGATTHPTLVVGYLERGSGLNGTPRHVFAIGDYVEASQSYVPSFVHVPGDSLREFRRVIDHADLTGDGVDEIVLEGWRTGSDSFLVFLAYKDGHWREVARGATSWCADPG